MILLITGLAASGKSTLARQLAERLALPLFDKDDLLERLYDDCDEPTTLELRPRLSRQADAHLARLAAGRSAIVVSWSRRTGWTNAGTPTAWLANLQVVELYCRCLAEEAARRFVARRRHPGHLDSLRKPDIAAWEAESALGPLALGWPVVEVDTAVEPDLDVVVAALAAAGCAAATAASSRSPRPDGR